MIEQFRKLLNGEAVTFAKSDQEDSAGTVSRCRCERRLWCVFDLVWMHWYYPRPRSLVVLRLASRRI